MRILLNRQFYLRSIFMKKIIRSSMVSIAIILFLNIPSIVLALDLSAKYK